MLANQGFVVEEGEKVEETVLLELARNLKIRVDKIGSIKCIVPTIDVQHVDQLLDRVSHLGLEREMFRAEVQRISKEFIKAAEIHCGGICDIRTSFLKSLVSTRQ
eukprot:GHVS01102695.1.p1 GENE.GHVS01102695.1~~GHVS01102695.1.p1  ORF type:complete len:105 (-),score=12.79 GHVS01102695.1:166-480(-)